MFASCCLCLHTDVFPLQTEREQPEGFGAFVDGNTDRKAGFKRLQNSSKTSRVRSGDAGMAHSTP